MPPIQAVPDLRAMLAVGDPGREDSAQVGLAGASKLQSSSPVWIRLIKNKHRDSDPQLVESLQRLYGHPKKGKSTWGQTGVHQNKCRECDSFSWPHLCDGENNIWHSGEHPLAMVIPPAASFACHVTARQEITPLRRRLGANSGKGTQHLDPVGGASGWSRPSAGGRLTVRHHIHRGGESSAAQEGLQGACRHGVAAKHHRGASALQEAVEGQ